MAAVLGYFVGQAYNGTLVPLTTAYFVLGAAHAIVYWIMVSFLTPLILLVGLFNERRRLLHDMLVGSVVINNEVRANALRVLSRRGL